MLRPVERDPSLEDAIVLHITGLDRPGVTATVTRILAEEGGKLIDLGQSVLHGHLTLSAIAWLPAGSDAIRRILFAMSKLGLRAELDTLEKAAVQARPQAAVPESLCVTLLGDITNGKAVAATTGLFAARGMNIREIRSLADGELAGLELLADLPVPTARTKQELAPLRGEILSLAGELGVDMAVQRDDVFRKNKRLVCFDVDSTFIQMEVIDELARLNGAGQSVAVLTERAMRGELDFATALQKRVGLLAGLPLEKAAGILDKIPLTPGAEKLVSTLKALGFHIGLVSGGFDFLVDELKRRFGLDFAVSNKLEVVDGKLSGRTLGAVVDAERKAQVLRDMAQAFRCKMAQTVAVGDGANDSLMLQAAGLGIAFRAKPKLQTVADLSLNRSSLDSILFLMGYHERDLVTLGD